MKASDVHMSLYVPHVTSEEHRDGVILQSHGEQSGERDLFIETPVIFQPVLLLPETRHFSL